MNIRVIILDVDGTLFTSRHDISPATKEALLKAQEAGIKLVLASGRPVSGLTRIGEELRMSRHHGLFVAYNGSKVVDCETQNVLFNQALSVAEGKAVLEHLKQFEVYPMIDKGAYMYVNNVYTKPIICQGQTFNVVEYEARGGGFLLCEQADLAAFLDYEVNKILTAGDPDYMQEHYRAMMEPFKDRLSCMFTCPFYFEYTARGIDKAKALDTVLRPLGYLPEEMIAFGDSLNDLSMIDYAGTGVAMGNAAAEVKARAQYVTASNDEDGIARALSRFLRAV